MYIITKCTTIEEALFNNKYIIIIDGDEYNVWGRMINCGLIDKNVLKNTETDIYFNEDENDTDS